MKWRNLCQRKVQTSRKRQFILDMLKTVGYYFRQMWYPVWQVSTNHRPAPVKRQILLQWKQFSLPNNLVLQLFLNNVINDSTIFVFTATTSELDYHPCSRVIILIKQTNYTLPWIDGESLTKGSDFLWKKWFLATWNLFLSQIIIYYLLSIIDDVFCHYEINSGGRLIFCKREYLWITWKGIIFLLGISLLERNFLWQTLINMWFEEDANEHRICSTKEQQAQLGVPHS